MKKLMAFVVSALMLSALALVGSAAPVSAAKVGSEKKPCFSSHYPSITTKCVSKPSRLRFAFGDELRTYKKLKWKKWGKETTTAKGRVRVCAGETTCYTRTGTIRLSDKQASNCYLNGAPWFYGRAKEKVRGLGYSLTTRDDFFYPHC